MLKSVEIYRVVRRDLTNHPLCLRLEEDHTAAIAHLPPGYWPDAVRCDFRAGKTMAMKRIRAKLEQIWQEDSSWK